MGCEIDGAGGIGYSGALAAVHSSGDGDAGEALENLDQLRDLGRPREVETLREMTVVRRLQVCLDRICFHSFLSYARGLSVIRRQPEPRRCLTDRHSRHSCQRAPFW